MKEVKFNIDDEHYEFVTSLLYKLNIEFEVNDIIAELPEPYRLDDITRKDAMISRKESLTNTIAELNKKRSK